MLCNKIHGFMQIRPNAFNSIQQEEHGLAKKLRIVQYVQDA